MISIIMISAGPHWARLTQPAIAGLRKHCSGAYELITVDNGGNHQGDLNIDEMVPYASAVNRGAALATGDRLLILNNDIVVTGDPLPLLGRANLEGPTIRRIHIDVDYVEGWALSIDHRLWDLLGGFDENYRNSWEDVDLAWRCKLLGWHPTLIPSFPLSHIYNGTRQHVEGANRWDFVNETYFARKKERYLDATRTS